MGSMIGLVGDGVKRVMKCMITLGSSEKAAMLPARHSTPDPTCAAVSKCSCGYALAFEWKDEITGKMGPSW